MNAVQRINKFVYTYAPNLKYDTETVNKLMNEFLTNKEQIISESYFENAKICIRNFSEFREYVKSRVGFRYEKDLEILNDIKKLIFRMCKDHRDNPEYLSNLMITFRQQHNPKLPVSQRDIVNAKYCKKYMSSFMLHLYKNN